MATVLGSIAAPANLDDVLLGIDEDANVLWAVEQRVDGADVAPQDPDAAEPDDRAVDGQVVVTGRPTDATTAACRPAYRYLPSRTVPPFWHPYLMIDDDERRRFVQTRLADLTARPVSLEPGPMSRLLRTPDGAADEPDHTIDPSAIPRRGLRIERRHLLGRRTDGLPVLWVQRSTMPLQAPPVSGLRFDEVEETHPVAGDLS